MIEVGTHPVSNIRTAEAVKVVENSQRDIIVAVAHKEFRKLSLSDIKTLLRDGADEDKALIDAKGLYKVEELKVSGLGWWRL